MSELKTMVEESVTRLFEEQVDREYLTQVEDTGFPKDLWETIIELGIDRVLVSEERGGMNGTWQDAYPIIRASGLYSVPLPIPEIIISHWLMSKADLTLRDGIPGIIPVLLNGDSDSLTAEITQVPWGRNADYFVGLDNRGSGVEVVVIDKENATITPDQNLARDPRDTVSFNKAQVIARGDCDLNDNALRCAMALMRSAQIAGAGSACLKLGLEYTSEREQFGRPLARFQAIQHHLANMASELATVEAMSASAFDALEKYGLNRDNASNAVFDIAAAKCRASDAVEPLSKIGHQVHGAIGFTYEYGLHFLTRRLWSWRAEFGGSSEWATHLGTVAVEAGGDEIWSVITR
ncbi:MAG: acyl-CoA dehydrogenase family protein [Pseudomonadota bacterium]